MISNGIIKLSPANMDCVPEFHRAVTESYPELKIFMDWANPDQSLQDTAKIMQQAILDGNNNENELRFIIQTESDDRVVGCIGLVIRNLAIPYFEIGYWCRSSDAGQGYMTMAVLLIESHASKELKAKRLEIKMAESNTASKRVAEKAGFQHEATLHADRLLPTGKIDNTLIYYKLYS